MNLKNKKLLADAIGILGALGVFSTSVLMQSFNYKYMNIFYILILMSIVIMIVGMVWSLVLLAKIDKKAMKTTVIITISCFIPIVGLIWLLVVYWRRYQARTQMKRHRRSHSERGL